VTGHEAPVPGAEYLGRDFQAVDFSKLPAIDIGNHQSAAPNRQSTQISPPLARMFWLVIQRASSPANSATTSAMSWGCPSPPSAAI
jgi:hypothetical protein